MTQPLSQEEFAAKAIDYLDGRLGDDARAAFEAALQAHPDWADEVRALAATWQHARQALSSVQEKAPARVRQHVLAQAAKRAAEIRAQAAPKVASTGVWQRLRVWLWSRPWVAPAMLAAAAVGIYVFSQSDHPIKARNQVPAVSNESMPAVESPPSTGRLLDTQQGAPAEREASVEAKQEERAARDERRPQTRARLPGADDAIGFGAPKDKAGRAAPATLPQRRNSEVAAEPTAYSDGEHDAAGGVGAANPAATTRKSATAARSASRARKLEPETEEEQDRSAFAQPPPAWPHPAPDADTARAERPLEGVATGGAASAPAAPPAAAKPAPAAPPPSPAPAAEANNTADAQHVGARAGRADSSSLVELSRSQLVERAQQAERERRWAVAVSLYRELLRRYGEDKLAASWRQRLAAAQAASSQRQ